MNSDKSLSIGQELEKIEQKRFETASQLLQLF